jgi:hypothetical protein
MAIEIIIIKEFQDLLSMTNLIERPQICLVAHPDFASNYGVRYYLIAQQKLQKLLPSCKITLGIACHDSASFALEVIAAKVSRVYFFKNSPYWPKIDSLCHQSGILLYDQQDLSCLL